MKIAEFFNTYTIHDKTKETSMRKAANVYNRSSCVARAIKSLPMFAGARASFQHNGKPPGSEPTELTQLRIITLLLQICSLNSCNIM